MQTELLKDSTRLTATGPEGSETAPQHGLQASSDDLGDEGKGLGDQRAASSNYAAARSAPSGDAQVLLVGVKGDNDPQENNTASLRDPGTKKTREVAPPRSLRLTGVPRTTTLYRHLRLEDLPNEILTHILSHLHPDSHGAVALVSKRFYALVNEPHAWRAGFSRYFRGHESCRIPLSISADADTLRSEPRYFTRMTPLATWRSEYLLRTRLLRSIARGKPGSSGVLGAATRSSQAQKRASAVLTYNSKLPWVISNVHAVFTAGKKLPKVIHGTNVMSIASTSDPTTGKIDKWGLDDDFSFAHLDDVFPDLVPYGLGDGPVAVPNVLDVSQPYGKLGGEGFPGGRAHFRAPDELRGRYLGQDDAVIDMHPEMPKIPELIDAISAVWIAKSFAVPSITRNLVGMMTGSTLGVLTSYAVGHDASGPRYSAGEITARWVLCPGVPIIAIQADDFYTVKRQSQRRVWAAALNALGEVFYLTSVPQPLTGTENVHGSVRNAWLVGRSVSWELIELTRRQARPDDFDKNAVRGGYTPRSPANTMGLSHGQIVAEAREIEKYFRYSPAHFRKVCEGWDMHRRLVCDFAGGDEEGAGEQFIVATSGLQDDMPLRVERYVRNSTSCQATPNQRATSGPQTSIFGGPVTSVLSEDFEAAPAESSTWLADRMHCKTSDQASITAVCIDMSIHATSAWFEDPILSRDAASPADHSLSLKLRHTAGDIPGGRSRLFGVGLSNGKIVIWDARAKRSNGVDPVRTIETESPSITALACSSLYLVHGGSDGLVQAWDPLASTLEPIRTLSSRLSGRLPRHMLNSNPTLRDANHAAVGALFLDPDPVVLRGIVTFGTFVRCWTFSSTGQFSDRRRRKRHSDMHGRMISRRQGGTVMGRMAAEVTELRQEQEHRHREDTRLLKRFGVGLADLTEDQALQYAQMVSEEAFLADELRRTSASDTASTVQGGAASSSGSLDTITPDPSVSGVNPSVVAGPSASVSSPLPNITDSDDDYEQQIQRALRLSLMEGVNDDGQSPRRSSSAAEVDYPIKYKAAGKQSKRSASKSPSSSQTHTPLPLPRGQVQPTAAESSARGQDDGQEGYFDADLDLALRLSLEDAGESQRQHNDGIGASAVDVQALEADVHISQSKGKGKDVNA